MKIKSVKISNFKNMIGNHSFNLSERFNIFFAENGFGKSSFFDAIEWCLTGKISRFEDFNDNDVINYNVKSNIHECSVTIEFSKGSIKRYFNVENFEKIKNCQVLVSYKDEDGKIKNANGKKYINYLIKNNNFIGDGYLSKIKDTHILSQDQISDFINADNPKKRYESLLSIIGLENKVLIDNFRGINKLLSKEYQKIDLELNNLINKRETIYSQKELIDENEMLKNLITIESREKLSKHIDLKNKQEAINYYYEYINTSNSNKDHNIKNFRKDIINKQNQIKLICKMKESQIKDIASLNKNLKLKTNLINQIESKMREEELKCLEIENQLTLILNEKNTIEHIISIKATIDKKLNELKNTNIIDQDIKKKHSLEVEIEKLNYAIEKKDTLYLYKNQYNNLLETIENIEEDVKNKYDNLQNLKQTLNEIESNECTIDTKDLINLVDSLNSMKEYIKNKYDLECCPLCNSNIDKVNILEQININISKVKSELEIKDSRNAEALKLRQILRDKITNEENKCKQLESTLKFRKNNKDSILGTIRKIIDDIQYSEEIFEKELVQIKNIKNEKISKLQLINKYIQLSKEIAKLKEENEHFLINDNYEFNQNNLEDIIKKLYDELEKNKSNISNFKSLLKETENQLEVYRYINYNLDENILKYDNDLNVHDLEKKLREQIEYIESKVEALEYINLEMLKIYRNKEKDIKISNIDLDIKRIESSLEKLNEKIQKNENYIQSIISKSEEFISKNLNNDKSPVKRYYTYLNPMPFKQNLYFETNNEEKLFIQLECEEKGVIRMANKTLSSGQMNVLALSIFLAMNENQKISELDLIAIDDPIQNMDDINQFSVCDILGNIKKQLIFSTHDVEFVKLFLKKNNHLREHIKIFNFKSPCLTPDKVITIE